jgi:predicted HTH domain antitoxin
VLSEQHLRQLLGLETRFAVHQWLERRNIPLQYTRADLASDLNALRELGLR